jgi:hypothetical protein
LCKLLLLVQQETFKPFARNSPGIALFPILYRYLTKKIILLQHFKNGIYFSLESPTSQTLTPNNVYRTRPSKRVEIRRHNYIPFLLKRACLKFSILLFSHLNPYKKKKVQLTTPALRAWAFLATNSGLKD